MRPAQLIIQFDRWLNILTLRGLKTNQIAAPENQFEPLDSWRYVKVTNHRTTIDFARFIREPVDELDPEVEKIVLVMGNLNAHRTASL